MNKISNFVRKSLSAGVLAVLAAGNVHAAAFVDSALQQQQTGSVKVIVMIRDRVAPVRSFHSTASYIDVRRSLQENARVSQKDVLDTLKAQPGFLTAIKVRPLWIINAMIVTLPASQISLLSNHPDVRAIYKNRVQHLIRDYRERPAASDAYTYGLEKLNIPQLREQKSNVNGSGVVVGILDTGVAPNHPDLAGKVVNFKDFVNGKAEAYDDHGHGTHVSGTIAGGNTSGTAIGIAPSAKIVMGKVFGSDGSSDDETLLKGMQWIADPDGNPATHDQPSLVSNSWGGGAPSPSIDPSGDVFCTAIDSWLKLGIFPVFAAGNEGPDTGSVGSPGACPAAFAVGATDKNDAIASFSSRGPTVWKSGKITKPNISAPGVNIMSAAPNGKYQNMSGTSMATPHVAGLLTLIYQVMPNITVDDAAKLVSASSKDLGTPGLDPVFGAGRIDALAAVNGAKAFRAAHTVR